MKDMLRIFRKERREILSLMKNLILWLSAHYTWVSVIVLGIMGAVLIPFLCWFCRYERYDWWRWKSSARLRTVLWWLALCAAKIILLEM